jgi:hypothetical protein
LLREERMILKEDVPTLIEPEAFSTGNRPYLSSKVFAEPFYGLKVL